MDICVEYLPSRQLRSSVECIWRTEPVVDTRFEIIPHGSVDACFVLSENKPRILVFGTTTKTSSCQLEAGAVYFGVRFRPGKATSFIRETISELTDRQVATPDFLGLSAEEMLEIKTAAGRRTRLELALTGAISGGYDRPAAVLDHAVSQIESRGGDMRVRDAAESCNLSERQLERLFLQRVGVPPKLFMRIRRFRSVLHCLEDPASEEPPKLAEVAVSYGYVDQSHLVRDFQSFSHPLPI